MDIPTTILPIIDYAGFLLLSCGVSERSDLQKMQNDILRLCCKITLNEHYISETEDA